MSKSWVLKIPRSDGEGYLLLQAATTSDSALDLNLLATEGEAPYRGKIRQRKTADLRAKNYHGSDKEWQNILCHVFNHQPATSLPEDEHKGLEVIAAIGNGKVTITLRNRIDKITQRLGTVDLSQDDDAEIQLFDWCGSAIDQESALQAEQSDLRRKYESTQATIASLDAKLEELVKAKADHEEELISKFVLLLNEKKLKIRNQQRILSTAKVDQKKLQQMQKTLDGKDRLADSSRADKRRADAQASEEDGEAQDDSSDAFEKMDVDRQEGIVAESQDGSSGRQTTPETGTATESDGAGPESIQKASPAPKPKNSFRAKASKKTNSPPPSTSKTRQNRINSASPPPPVRQLPFAKKGAKGTNAPEPAPEPTKPQIAKADSGITRKANDSDEETASDDDDEL